MTNETLGQKIDELEAAIAEGRAKMEAAIAALPFRPTPTFEDMYTAVEAMFRHFATAHLQPGTATEGKVELPPSTTDSSVPGSSPQISLVPNQAVEQPPPPNPPAAA